MSKWSLVVEVELGRVPAIVRLRRALYCLQRAYGIRCIAVDEDPVGYTKPKRAKCPKKPSPAATTP
jgi:hypothetical protein